MSLTFKVDVETIDNSPQFVLRLISPNASEIKSILEVLNANKQKIYGKEFSEDNSGFAIEMGGNFYSLDGKAKLPEHVVGSQIANYANRENAVNFLEALELEELMTGLKIAAYANR